MSPDKLGVSFYRKAQALPQGRGTLSTVLGPRNHIYPGLCSSSTIPDEFNKRFGHQVSHSQRELVLFQEQILGEFVRLSVSTVHFSSGYTGPSPGLRLPSGRSSLCSSSGLVPRKGWLTLNHPPTHTHTHIHMHTPSSTWSVWKW